LSWSAALIGRPHTLSGGPLDDPAGERIAADARRPGRRTVQRTLYEAGSNKIKTVLVGREPGL
jgi:hypothetical protein